MLLKIYINIKCLKNYHILFLKKFKMSTNPRRTLIPKNEFVNERTSSPVRARSPVNRTPMDNSSKAVIQQKSLADLEAERYAMRQKEQAAMREKQRVNTARSALPTYEEFLDDYMYGLYALEIFTREYTKNGKEKESHDVPVVDYMVCTLRINKRCKMCDFDISTEESGAKPTQMNKQKQLAQKEGFTFTSGSGMDTREIKVDDKVFMRIRRLQRFNRASPRTPAIEFYKDFLTNIAIPEDAVR